MDKNQLRRHVMLPLRGKFRSTPGDPRPRGQVTVVLSVTGSALFVAAVLAAVLWFLRAV